MATDSPTIQFKPTHRPAPDGCGFENGQLVPVTQPPGPDAEQPTPADSIDEAEVALIRRQAANHILEILTDGADVPLAGQRGFLLAHRLKLSGCKTQKELADRMGLSTGRISQIVKRFNAHLRRMNID